MEDSDRSKKLDARIKTALAKYAPSHDLLGDVEKALAKQIVKLVEHAGGRSAAAEKMNIGPTTLDNYRSGKTQPKILELIALCEAAGIALTDVFERDAGFTEDSMRVIVSPARYAGPELFNDLLAEIGEMVTEMYAQAGLALTRNNEYRLAAEGYNRLTDRVMDPYSLEELRSMLPWLRLSFKRDIDEQISRPGSGKRSAS